MKPDDIAELYADVALLLATARHNGLAVPVDIDRTWPNVLGFMRRIPGQRFYRPPPAPHSDEPAEREVEAFVEALGIHKRRLERVFKER